MYVVVKGNTKENMTAIDANNIDDLAYSEFFHFIFFYSFLKKNLFIKF